MGLLCRKYGGVCLIMTKKLFVLFGAITTLLVAACGTSDTETLEESTLKNVPVLVCNGDETRKTIVEGEWDFSSGQIYLAQDDIIGNTTDWFELSSLRWDGDDEIICPNYLLSTDIYRFQEDVSLIPEIYNTFISAEIEFHSADNKYVIRYKGKNFPLNVDLKGIEENSTYINILNNSGVSILSAFEKDGKAYLLLTPDSITEDGLCLLCTTIDLTSGAYETNLVNQTPFSFENIMLAVLNQNNYGNDGNYFYFSAADQIYKIDPASSHSVSLCTIDKISNVSIESEFFDDIWVSNDLIIVESEPYQNELGSYPNYHAFTLNGNYFATYINTEQLFCAFPKL